MSWLILLSTLSAAIAAIASVISIFLNKKNAQEQRDADSKIAREQRAADSVKRYTELALQYPKLSTDISETVEQQREWFVSFMLIMSQDILRAHEHDEVWRNFAKRQMGFFKEDLEPWTDDDLKEYDKGVRDLVREVAPTKKS